MLVQVSAQRRRGIMIPLAALLSVFLVAMVAFAVDIGWITVTESELQNGADAAALAGVNSLMDGYVQYNLPNQTAQQKATILADAQTTARTKAKTYALANAAGGVSSLTLLDTDIEFGFIDAQNKYTTAPTYTGYPNTIKVTLRRDSQANTSLKLFFGPVVGKKTTDLTATASATMYTGTIDSYTPSKLNVGMVPITYDINHWNDFIKTGKGPDGTTLNDSGGNPQLEVYPSIKFPGNFGQLSLSDSHVGASTEKSWVTDGVPSGDIQALLDHDLIPLSKHDSKNWDWLGDTGFKASLIMTINDQAGKTFLLPLFTPVNSSSSDYQAGTGKGSNFNFNIVQFVGVRIMTSPDYNREVVIQPAAYVQPDSVFVTSSITPAGTTSTVATTFATPKLSR